MNHSTIQAAAERLFAQAAATTAKRLDGINPPRGYITEIRHLQRPFRDALIEGAAAESPRPAVSPSLKVLMPQNFKRLGSFDVSLAWSEGTVYGELKAGGDDLGHCAWDALKCATAVALGHAAATLLVAAAPAETWPERKLGAELFNDDEFDAVDLRTRYVSWFGHYERKDKQWPIRVPARVRSTRLADAEFTVSGQPWMLAVARIEPADAEWFDWPRYDASATPAVTPSANARSTGGPAADGDVTVEQHPAGYPWKARFPGAELLAGLEGGAVFTAEAEASWWLISDESTMADFLHPDDDADLLARLVTLRRFGSRAAWEVECTAALAKAAPTSAG
jgi:hypothetical protein